MLRGTVLGRGHLPTDPNFLRMTDEQLLFLNYWQTKREQDFLDVFFKRLGRMLGVYWKHEDLQNVSTSAKDEVWVPLSFIIRPGFQDTLKKILVPASEKDKEMESLQKDGVKEEMINLADLDKDEFFELMTQIKSAAAKKSTAGEL